MDLDAFPDTQPTVSKALKGEKIHRSKTEI